MSWSRGFFRGWIAVTAVWLAFVGLLFYNSIKNPYISWGGYLYSQNISQPPNFMLVYSPEFHEAERRRSAGELEGYEIASESLLKSTTYFFPTAMSEADQLRLMKANHEQDQSAQLKLISEKRWERFIDAIKVALSPPIILLLIGLVIRWVITGFRRQAPPHPPTL